MTIPVEFNKPESLRTLGNYLRGSNGVKSKTATQHEKRVDYFRGSRLLECLVENNDSSPLVKWPKTLPKIRDTAVAIGVAELLIQNDYFHRSEKVPDKKKLLRVSKNNVFEESGYYTWMYEGSMMWSNIGTVLLISAVIAFTLLPIWPDILKKGLWYLSVTFLIFTFSFIFIRFSAFTCVWIFGYEFWIFPNLFDESLTFYDSFKPTWMCEKAAVGQGYYRMGLVGGMIAFIFWVMTQPTEFDTFLQGQKSFLDDLYSGNLLADVAADHKENLDKVRVIPKLEDLLHEDDGEAGRMHRGDAESGGDALGMADIARMMEDTLEGEVQEDAGMDAMLEELTRLEEEEEAAATAAAATAAAATQNETL